MKLKSSGVFISILILIMMILICHTMNFFYPKNKFVNIDRNSDSEDTPKKTDYNQIYYSNESDKKQLCANVDQAEIPCDIVRTCITESNTEPVIVVPEITSAPTLGLNSLSNSELAMLYKFAYEESAREILMRKLKEIKETEEANSQWDF